MGEYKVYYTGDLVTPDGSDTWVYGDPCEPGAGAALESGWLDPDWTRWEVYQERDHVRPDVMPDDYDGTPAQWLAETVGDRLGAIDSMDGTGTFYAADSDQNYTTGQELSMAAHAEGFTDAEVAAAEGILQTEQTYRFR
jgi:hypothetical protein